MTQVIERHQQDIRSPCIRYGTRDRVMSLCMAHVTESCHRRIRSVTYKYGIAVTNGVSIQHAGGHGCHIHPRKGHLRVIERREHDTRSPYIRHGTRDRVMSHVNRS